VDPSSGRQSRRQPEQPRAADRPDYDLAALLDLSTRVEELGFDSVWVGDSLFSKPRYEAMRSSPRSLSGPANVRLGTACLVSSMAQPALPRARVGDARRDLGRLARSSALHGQSRAGRAARVRGARLPFGDRATVFEEGLEVLSDLFRTGRTSFKGTYSTTRTSPFTRGRRWRRCARCRRRPRRGSSPTPASSGDKPTEKMRAIMERACDRIIRLGDGWMNRAAARSIRRS